MARPTYHIPPDQRFDALRREAEHYLTPVGFAPSEVARGPLHIAVQAGSSDAESYAVERRVHRGRSSLTIRSDGARGAAHGLHRVLRLLGFGFSFFADARPGKPALAWTAAGDRLAGRPEFETRGLLPWHNFLNSPTTWNADDYRQFLLTLWRWGGNTALFHSYDNEPLTAFRDRRGMWQSGQGMATSLDGPWGGIKGLKVSDFAHGTGSFFKDAVRGAWGAANASARDPIAAAQAGFADVCTLGREIGLDVGLGFELRGSPTAPGAMERVRRRLAHLLAVYPDLHTLHLFQAEGNGQRGWLSWSASPGYAGLHKKHGKHFRYLAGNPERLAEGVRIAEWFLCAYRMAKELRPSIRVAFSCWGGDHWMRSGDFWRGLHGILPPEAALSQLDNIDPRSEDTVSRAAAGLGRDRALWSIPWIESDSAVLGRASQWHPQDDATHMLTLARSAKKLGYRGLLGIHWQTAGVETNASCLLAAGWDLSAGVEAWRLDTVRTFYSRQARPAAAVARILGELEDLGAGWAGTGQQVECSAFSWDPFPPVTTGPMPKSLRALGEMLEKTRVEMFRTPRASFQVWCAYDALRFMFEQKRGNPDSIGQLARLRSRWAALDLDTPHARRMLATMDFVLSYESIRRQLAPGGRLLLQQELLTETKTLGLRPERALLAAYRRGLRQIEATWRRVFAAQAARLDTRGDLGNLVNLNIKAYQAWKKFRDTPVV